MACKADIEGLTLLPCAAHFFQNSYHDANRHCSDTWQCNQHRAGHNHTQGNDPPHSRMRGKGTKYERGQQGARIFLEIWEGGHVWCRKVSVPPHPPYSTLSPAKFRANSHSIGAKVRMTARIAKCAPKDTSPSLRPLFTLHLLKEAMRKSSRIT